MSIARIGAGAGACSLLVLVLCSGVGAEFLLLVTTRCGACTVLLLVLRAALSFAEDWFHSGLKQYKYPSANYTFALPCTRKTPCQPCATGTPLQEEDSWSAVAITKQGESPLITELNALVTARQAIPHPTISTANPSIAHHSICGSSGFMANLCHRTIPIG